MGSANVKLEPNSTVIPNTAAEDLILRASAFSTLQPTPVPWSSEIDNRKPRHWPLSRKWLATAIVSAIAFLQPLAEAGLAPAETQMSLDLHIQYDYQWMLVNSLLLIGIGLSALVLAPLSEMYGRKPVLLAGSVSFLIWNTGCGAVRTLDQMLALRLLSGFGASVGDAVAGGILSDLWCAEDRGKAFAVFMAVPLLGTAIGPICGAFISEGVGWRWVFWITSIATATTVMAAVVFLRETYEPKVEQSLRRKMKLPAHYSHGKTLSQLLRFNLQRPFRMLGTQVIIQLLAVYMSILYGIMWLFLFIYPRIWQEKYQQSVRIASLNYLSFGLGMVAGVNVAGFLNDRIFIYLKARNGGVGRPEFRIPTIVIGTILTPAGLICWGWAGEAKLHWIVPNIGSFVFATGVYVCSACVSVYTIDTYTKYAASAISTNLVARGLTAAVFPLFAPKLFDYLDFGIGASILAAGFGIFGIVVAAILWFFGEALRARSPYCAVSDDK